MHSLDCLLKVDLESADLYPLSEVAFALAFAHYATSDRQQCPVGVPRQSASRLSATT